MPHRFKASIAALALSAALAACSGDDNSGVNGSVRPDSSSGEVAQYALMKNRIGWLTDSNIVALAAQVNGDAQAIPRLEAQAWSKDAFRLIATEILRDHAGLQASIDSVASVRHLPSQMPAVAPELKLPYDSLLNSQVGLSVTDREAQFVDMVVKVHARTVVDFAALAVNATDPDLKALLANRAVQMEQTHLARAQLLAAAIVRSDSAKQDSTKKQDSTRASGRAGRR
jgi:hypothetical protein